MYMSQTWHFNGCDSRENQQGDYSAASPCSVLEHIYAPVDPAMLAQKNNDMVVRGPRIVLICGPQDDEEDDE
jgi:hypothetical protein